MSKLLVNEKPLMVIPSLAAKLGLNEAVVLQQMHYWVSISKHMREGKKWIFNTYKDWQEQFPFWSESTIKRTIHSLEKQGCLVSRNWNQKKMDKTKWYTIDYHQLEELEPGQSDPSTAQNDPIVSSERPVEEVNTTQAIPESTTEKEPIVDIIDYLNETTFSNYKPTTRRNKKLIRARLQEGFTIEDFKKVIDLKADEWLDHPEMCKYLRPETLFGNKFESYLNQKSAKKIYREEDYDFDE